MKSRKTLNLFDDYHDMMSDTIRMDAFRAAIEEVVQEGDVVLDLGSGLGILGFLALRAGASRVIAIEKGDSILLAREIARRNGLDDRIEFVHANSKDHRPTVCANVLVSETLGSFGVEENTLDFTIDARERLLAPGARMIPHRICLVLAPVEHPEGLRKADFWSNVQGFDFAPARHEVLSRMAVAHIEPSQLLAEPMLYADLHLDTIASPWLEGTLLFPVLRAGRIDGLAGWFEAALTEHVAILTSPMDPPTHWKQAFFPFRESMNVVAGDYLEVTFRVAPESSHSDNSTISYDVRCTQIAREPT